MIKGGGKKEPANPIYQRFLTPPQKQRGLPPFSLFTRPVSGSPWPLPDIISVHMCWHPRTPCIPEHPTSQLLEKSFFF